MFSIPDVLVASISTDHEAHMLCFEVVERSSIEVHPCPNSTNHSYGTARMRNSSERGYLLTQGQFIHDEKKTSVIVPLELK